MKCLFSSKEAEHRKCFLLEPDVISKRWSNVKSKRTLYTLFRIPGENPGTHHALLGIKRINQRFRSLAYKF